jgi:large subunit ribosomal protein L25
MIRNVVVEVQERQDLGKNANRRLRKSGKVPGVLYGGGLPPFSVAVGSRRIDEVLGLETGRNTIFTLQLEGQDKTRAAMIKDLQRDPVTERVVHVDFVRVDLEKKVRVDVPLRLVGTAEGVKTEGGLMEFVLRSVEVECLPFDIPERLDVDVSALHVGQHLSVKNIPVTTNVEILDDPDSIVCVVAVPREEAAPVVEEAAEPAAATAAEPELIKKGKETAGEESEAGKAEPKKTEAKKA